MSAGLVSVVASGLGLLALARACALWGGVGFWRQKGTVNTGQFVELESTTTLELASWLYV
jgi:hypothetical protein